MGKRKERDLLREQRNTVKGQHPAAIVLSCMDSRAPVELIFNLGIGDTFTSCVAGNKLVLVMGHTACRAIKGAIDKAQPGNLTGLLEKIRPAVEATQYDGARVSTNAAFVTALARKNVELTTAGIRTGSSVLKDLEDKGRIKIAGAMYHLDTAVVEFLS